MGYYRYCERCNTGLGRPTPREDLLEGGQVCWRCDAVQDELYSTRELLVELYEVIGEKEDLCY